MAAPTDTDLKYYGGSDGAPSEDDQPYCGAIYDVVELVEGTSDIIINTSAISDSAQTLYGGFYRKNEASGSLVNARFYNRAGMIPSLSSGQVQIISTSASDTAIKIRITGEVAGTIEQEDVTVTGQTPANSDALFDTGKIYMAEVLTSGGSVSTSAGNITLSVNSQVIAVIFGNSDPQVDPVNMVTSLYQTALATAKDTEIGADDRLNPSTGIGSFEYATKWSGSDQSLALPDNTLHGDEYIGVNIKLTIPAALPIPVAGYFQYLGVLVGQAIA